MPLFKSLDLNSQTGVKIWKIEESFDSLLEPLELKENSWDRVKNMKSEIHARGFLSVRHLLRAFGYKDADLYYDELGKPHLKDGRHISITHSFEYSGVIIGNHPNGIDIEKQRSKIKFIASKFIGYEESWLNFIDQDKVKSLTAIWCIKEALYKLYAQPGLSFKQHCLVIPFSLNDETTSCWIDIKDKKKKYEAQFLEFNNFSCAYLEDK